MVPVVRSTFKVLEELSRSGALGLAAITERTGISKSTVFRILTTLTNLGYIIRDADRNYFVSHTMGDLVAPEQESKRCAGPQCRTCLLCEIASERLSISDIFRWIKSVMSKLSPVSTR